MGLIRIAKVLTLYFGAIAGIYGQRTIGPEVTGVEIIRQQWTQKEGLPDWNISDILQDSRGLMWVASNSGLFTFDGFTFRMVDAVNERQVSGRIIRLAEDLHGNIWVVRQDDEIIRVEIFDCSTNKVQDLHRYVGLPDPVQFPIRENKIFFFNIGGKIWIGSRRQGYHYDGKWRKDWDSPASGGRYYLWIPAAKGYHWQLGEDKHIYLRDKASAKMGSYIQPGFTIRWCSLDEKLNLWVAFSKPGEQRIDHYAQLLPQSGAISVRYFSEPPKTTWSGQIITGSGWFRFNGFGKADASKTEDLFLGPPGDPLLFNLTQRFPDFNSIGVFHFDHTGSLWASNTNGLTRFTLVKRLPFTKYLSGSNQSYSMRGMAVKGDTLQVLSYNGHRKINLSKGSDTAWPILPNIISYTILKEKDVSWIGSHERPVFAIHDNGTQKTFPFEGAQLITYTLFRSKTLGLLAGTQQGVWRLDSISKKMIPTAFRNAHVLALYENQHGLWVVSSKGLFKLDQHFKVKRHVLAPGPTLRYTQLEHIYEDSQGRFWLASKGAGLLRWTPYNDALRIYNTKDGLSNNNIHCIYPDEAGYLWLTSDKGLMRFHPETEQIQAYFKEDGIADNEFNYASHCKAEDGSLFFGGINGITVFHPRDIPKESKTSKGLRIVEAKTFDIKKGEYFTQVAHSAPEPRLRIRPSDAYLDINLSPMLFENKDKLQYSWKITGLQNTWIYQEEPVIRLSKLPYGTQNLQVRYGIYGNGWSDAQTFPITVLRPFYLRWPFLMLALSTGIALVVLITSWRSRTLRRANLRLEREVRQRTREIEENLAVIERDKQTILEQAQALRSLDEMKSRFFTNVTHELRSPLTLILGPLERLIYNRVAQENIQEHLRTIQRNALKLLNLVEELLDLSKIEANKLTLEEKPTLLYPFLTRLIAGFSPYAQHRQIKLLLQYDCPNEFTLLLDQKKCEKILNNLIGNSMKFTPAKGTITLSVRYDSPNLIMEVADTGSGIPPEDLPFVFDRYYQSKSKESQLQGGTGIGLSLGREYARLFGGDLSLSSKLGEGTIAYFTFLPKILPITASEYPQDLHFLQHEGLFSPTAPKETLKKPQPTILIVEDDKDMLDYIASILSPDYRLLLAENGISGLKQLESSHVDLVLSDVMMPEMDGFQLLQATKERYQDLPFILLTARIESPDRLHALRLGVDDYLTKPFVEEELSVRLQNLLQRYEIRRNIRTQTSQDHLPAKNNPDGEEIQAFDKKWLMNLESIVQAQLKNPHLSVQTLAEKMNISERTLQNKIKAYTGLTPNQYLTEARLQKARALLEARAFQTVAEVCYAVGFKTTQYFSAMMKKRFGKAPSDYGKDGGR